MNSGMLKDKISFALEAITADNNFCISTAQAIHGLLDDDRLSDTDIEKIISRAVFTYDGKTKTPKLAFWRRIKAEVLQDSRVNRGERTYEYIKPSESERKEAARIARETAEKLNSHKSLALDKGGAYTRKMARFREYAKSDMVGVNAPDTEWVPRADAESRGLKYIDPVVWLEHKTGVSRGF